MSHAEIEFVPRGAPEWLVPVEKAGKAGRDGDGDGILNEGSKQSDRRSAAASAGGAAAGAAAAGAGAIAINRRRKQGLSSHEAKGKSVTAAAEESYRRMLSFHPKGSNPSARTGIYSGPNGDLNRASRSEAFRNHTIASDNYYQHMNGPAPKKVLSRGKLALGGALAGAALGYGADKLYSRFGKSGSDESMSVIEMISKAYAADITAILASDTADKPAAIAKAGEVLAEAASNLLPKLDIAKSAGPIGFDASLAQTQASMALAEANEVVDHMVSTLTKAVGDDPAALEAAVQKFDADMTEFLSLAFAGEEAEPEHVAKAAPPVFVPLAG